MLEDLASLQLPVEQKQQREVERWKGPEQGWIKVNTDAAFIAETGSGTSGVVIRNHNGRVVAGAARWQDNLADALMAEAMAAKEGLELAVEIGCDRHDLCFGLMRSQIGLRCWQPKIVTLFSYNESSMSCSKKKKERASNRHVG